MSRLYMVLYSMIGTAMAGSGVIAALTMGMDRLAPILTGAAIGAALALPVSWVIARRITDAS